MDVEKRLEHLIKSENKTKRVLINDLLRKGMDSIKTEEPSEKVIFQTKCRDLGACRFPNLDNISEVLAVAEGDSFK